jgi:hypothetical protein
MTASFDATAPPQIAMTASFDATAPPQIAMTASFDATAPPQIAMTTSFDATAPPQIAMTASFRCDRTSANCDDHLVSMRPRCCKLRVGERWLPAGAGEVGAFHFIRHTKNNFTVAALTALASP